MPLAVFASDTSGTISGYAWSPQLGWFNFGATHGGAGISDAGLTGSAWNENSGWISLNPDHGNVHIDSGGHLSGSIWVSQSGWMSLSGVSVDVNGAFAGTATGDNGVSIVFSCTNCNVTTDYRPADFRTTGGGGGGGGGGGSSHGNPGGVAQNLLINNGNPFTNDPNVTLAVYGESDAVAMQVSNSHDFIGSVKESYASPKAWKLSSGSGKKTVYVRFYNKLGGVSQLFANISLNAPPPTVAITNIKQAYFKNEHVVIGGTTQADNLVSFSLDNNAGFSVSSSDGTWLVDLGPLSVGNHSLQARAIDPSGTVSQSESVNFGVRDQLAPPAPLLEQIGQGLKQLLPFIPTPPAPQPVVIVPKAAPFALSLKGNLLAFDPIKEFVFAPLPNEVLGLANKFPQLAKVFNETGINRLNNLSELSSAHVSLPTLSQSLALNTQLNPSKLPAGTGIPLAQLSKSAKYQIPSEILFVKDQTGLVDFNVALSLADNTDTVQQKIETVAGQLLQFVVRADKPVNTMTGYVVFTSKTPPDVSLNVSRSDLLMSNFLPNPSFVAALSESQVVNLEQQAAQQKNNQNTPTDTQKELIVSSFDYHNTGSGLYAATVSAPVPDGQYQVLTVIQYADKTTVAKEISMTMVVDPEGYVYEKTGNLETRISGAVVSLYWLNPETQRYELWPAKDFQQENPQTTDVRGSYSFLVPNGNYYIKVDAPGFASYSGTAFDVNEGGGIHVNVPLRSRYWWLSMVGDWKNLLLIAVILLLLYNFYKDRTRGRVAVRK